MEMLVSSSRQVAETEDDGTPALGKSGYARAERFSMGLAITVEGYRAIVAVDHGQVQFLVGLGLGSGTWKVLGAGKAVASGNPMARLPFPEDDGVKEVAGSLDAHQSATALVDVMDQAPDLEGPFPEVKGERAALQVGIVQDHHSILVLNLSVAFEMERSHRVPQVIVEFPRSEGIKVNRLLASFMASLQQSGSYWLQ